jgi:hypothetical protein
LIGLFLSALPTIAQDPAPTAREPAPFDKDRLILKRIVDLRPLSLEGGDEREPYEDVLLHAHAATADELLKAARRDISLNEMLDEKKERRDEVRFELVHIEGKLKRLKKISSFARLKDAGMADLYEAWIFPNKAGRGTDPVCVIVSRPPAGVEPAEDLTPGVPVVTAGYYFKVLEYASNQPNPKDPTRTLFRRAPLLLGQAIALGTDRPAQNASITDLATLSLVFGGVVMAALIGLAVWLRRTDAGSRRANYNRLRNPYTPPPDTPPAATN